jgi:hypothetical protein
VTQPTQAKTLPPPAGGLLDGVSRRLGALVAGTPGTMRLLGAAAALGALVFGVLGFVAVSSQSSAVASAQADAAQLVRLQRIHTNLVAADASATNAFLVGGLEPRASRVAYERGIARASTTLADAAAHDRDQAAELGRVNDALSRYTGLVESARANNRQGFPVGVAYVKQASALLHDDVLPRLIRLVDDGQEQVARAYGRGGSAPAGLWFGAALAIAAVLAASGWLASATRRVLNLPLAAAGIVVVVTFLAGAFLLSSSLGRAHDVRDGSYAAAVSLASARIAAFDAKSAESLTLISRGSGQAFEDRFLTQLATARTQAARADRIGFGAGDSPGGGGAVSDELEAYLAVHKTVRTDDDEGRYDEAVAIATGPGDKATTSNGSFAAFDRASGDALDEASASIAAGLRTARRPLGLLRWSLLVAALVAAVASWRGVAIRLQEYR